MLQNVAYLFVTPFFPSVKKWQGAYSLDFVKALQRQTDGRNVEVLVFVPGAGEDYEIEGIKVYRFPIKQLPSNIFPFLFRRYNERSFLSKVKEVLTTTVHLHLPPPPLATAMLVAVAHAHTANCAPYALAAKRAFGCKAILHHHDLASFGLNLGRLHRCWFYNVIQFPILRHLHEAIDCHVFISEASRRSFLTVPDTSWSCYEDYKKQYRGLGFYRSSRIKRSIILHNGVDTSVFKPTTNNQQPTTNFTIGCIGNFEELKDQATLIRAVGKVFEESIKGEAASLPLKQTQPTTQPTTLRVLFIGSGPTLETCRRLAAETEKKVNNSTVDLDLRPRPKLVFEFLPEVRHEQLPDFYHSLDLFVLPSYFEGFGCVYTEAWSCGVPFIACAGQGIVDLIAPEDRGKWLAKPRDAVDLAAKIRYYIDHRPEQRLTGPVDIDTLVGRFLEELEKLSQ